MASLWNHSPLSKALPLPPDPLEQGQGRTVCLQPGHPCPLRDGKKRPLSSHGSPHLPCSTSKKPLTSSTPPICPAWYGLQRALPLPSQVTRHGGPEHGFSILVTQAGRPRLRPNNTHWRRKETPPPILAPVWPSLCSALSLPPARAAQADWTEDRLDRGGTHQQGSCSRGKCVSQKPEDWGWGGEGRGD